MKKVLFLLANLIYLNCFAQQVIDNPKFSATTASNVKITKIELSDTATILHFEVDYFPKWWIYVSSSKTFIADTKSIDKLTVKYAEGIELDKKIWTPASGKNIYKLYFPPLPKSTETIDFEEEQWKIFDIEIIPQKTISIIPEVIQGNWLSTNGSNEWVIGLYNNIVIYDNELWNQISVNQKGKEYTLILQKNGESRNIYIKTSKNGLLYIGTDPKKKELVSLKKTIAKNFTIPNDKDFEQPVFNMDTAIYKGYIKGYHPKMGKTGMVYVNDILYQEQKSNLVSINPDGTFQVKSLILHPMDVYVRILGFNGSIYLEPGKTVTQYIDANEFSHPFKNNSDFNNRERLSLYMGEIARINADLQSTDTIRYFDYEQVQNQILDMNMEQYKIYCSDIMKKEQAAFQQYCVNNCISKKALTIRNLKIKYDTYEHILSYNNSRQSAYRKKNKVPRDQRTIPLLLEKGTPEYYSFIKPDELNNPLSLVSGGSYNYLLNRILFSECIRPDANYLYVMFDDTLRAHSIILSNEEQSFLNKLKECKDRDSLKILMKSDTAISNPFFLRYRSILTSVSSSAYYNYKNKKLAEYFGITEGFVKDIATSQSKCGILKASLVPFSESDLNDIKENIHNEFISNYLLQLSKAKEEEIETKLKENKNKTGYSINETPKTEGDKVFDAIIQKYIGKVIFVDFWATWCGPCRAGMEKMKPLKEEYKDKDIVFLYITDETSPIDTWNMMVPDIKGEHYRVKPDEWNFLKSRFSISGIPHYALVNKEGQIVKDKIYFASSSDEFRNLLNEYLK